jgi:hypothetical protein
VARSTGPRRLTPLNIIGTIVCLALFFGGFAFMGSAFDTTGPGRVMFVLGLVAVGLAFFIPQQIFIKVDGETGTQRDVRIADGSIARYNSHGVNIYQKQP